MAMKSISVRFHSANAVKTAVEAALLHAETRPENRPVPVSA
jgi:hypothetical protein